MTRAVDADFLAKFAEGAHLSLVICCVWFGSRGFVLSAPWWLLTTWPSLPRVGLPFVPGRTTWQMCIRCHAPQPSPSRAPDAPAAADAPPARNDLQAMSTTAPATGPPPVPCLRKRWRCGATAAATRCRMARLLPCCGEKWPGACRLLAWAGWHAEPQGAGSWRGAVACCGLRLPAVACHVRLHLPPNLRCQLVVCSFLDLPPPPSPPYCTCSVMAEHGYRAPAGWQGFRELTEK